MSYLNAYNRSCLSKHPFFLNLDFSCDVNQNFSPSPVGQPLRHHRREPFGPVGPRAPPAPDGRLQEEGGELRVEGDRRRRARHRGERKTSFNLTSIALKNSGVNESANIKSLCTPSGISSS